MYDSILLQIDIYIYIYIYSSYIAKFFVWCHSQKEKLSLQTEILQLQIFTGTHSGEVK